MGANVPGKRLDRPTVPVRPNPDPPGSRSARHSLHHPRIVEVDGLRAEAPAVADAKPVAPGLLMRVDAGTGSKEPGRC
jgi:hypothetical protein